MRKITIGIMILLAFLIGFSFERSGRIFRKQFEQPQPQETQEIGEMESPNVTAIKQEMCNQEGVTEKTKIFFKGEKVDCSKYKPQSLFLSIDKLGFVDKEVEVWCEKDDDDLYGTWKGLACDDSKYLNFLKTTLDGKEYYKKADDKGTPPTLYPVEDYRKYRLVPVK